jgi:hypothetical protein
MVATAAQVAVQQLVARQVRRYKIKALVLLALLASAVAVLVVQTAVLLLEQVGHR